MIKVDEVVNKTITDMHISYISTMTMQQTTGSAMTPRRWERRQNQAEDLVTVLFIDDSDRRESWLN